LGFLPLAFTLLDVKNEISKKICWHVGLCIWQGSKLCKLDTERERERERKRVKVRKGKKKKNVKEREKE
jgi:hypothetical protein